MITIKLLAERCLRVINLGDVPNDSRWTIRDINYLVRDALASYIVRSWFEGRQNQEMGGVSAMFTSSVDRTVQEDSSGECYVDIDFSLVKIPDDTNPLRVAPFMPANQNPFAVSESNTSAFIPVPQRFDDIYRNLPAQALEGNIGWSMRGKKVWFTRINNQNLVQAGISQVQIDVITVDEKVLADDQAMNIPDDAADAIVKGVMQFIYPVSQQPKDHVLDANSNLKAR